jgi:putative acetyltransferase
LGRFVVVAHIAEQLVSFAELEPNGHIDRVYVSADHQGQGIASELLRRIIEEGRRLALPTLFTEASITARPFFRKQGFQGDTPQTVHRRGVELVNYPMTKKLA